MIENLNNLCLQPLNSHDNIQNIKTNIQHIQLNKTCLLVCLFPPNTFHQDLHSLFFAPLGKRLQTRNLIKKRIGIKLVNEMPKRGSCKVNLDFA